MKELTLEQMETTQGGKFWGWGDCEPIGDWYIQPNGECLQQYHCKRYIFWMVVEEDEPWGGCSF